MEGTVTAADTRLSQKCRELDSSLNNRTTDLNNKIESTRSEFANQLHSSVTELSAKIDSTGSKLDKKIAAVETAAEGKISSSVSALQKNVDGAMSTLDSKIDDSILLVQKAIAESSKQLSKSIADKDAHTQELVKQEHRHFTEECLKIDKKHDAKYNELDMKFTNQFIREHQQFQADQDEQDEKHNLELKHLREDYVKLEGKFSQDLDEMERLFHEKNEKQDARADAVSRTVDQHHSYFETVTQQLHKKLAEETMAHSSIIKENYKELKHECTKLDQKLSDENSFLHSKWTTEKQGIDARLEDLEHTTETNRTDFTAEIVALGTTLKEISEEQTEARLAVLKHANTTADNLEKKLSASILQLADRQETQGKHFADTHTKLDKKFTESTVELNKRLVDQRAHLDAEVAEKVSAAEKKTDWVQKSLTDLINKEVQLVNDEIYELNDRVGETETKCDKSITSNMAEITDKIESEHRHFVGMCTNIDKAHSTTMADLSKKVEDLKADSEIQLTDMATQLSESTKKNTQALTAVAKSTRDESERLSSLVDDCWKRLSDKCDKVAEKATRQFADVDSKLATKEAALAHSIKELGVTLEKQGESQTALINEINQSHNEKSAEQDARLENVQSSLEESISTLKQSLFEENAARDQRTNVDNKKLGEAIEKTKAKVAADVQEIFRNFSQDMSRHEKSVSAKLVDYHKKSEHLDSRITAEIERMEENRNATATQLSQNLENRWEKLNERITTEVGDQEKAVEAQYEYFSTVCRRIQKDADDNKIALESKVDTRFHTLDERITTKASDVETRTETLQKILEEKHEDLRKRLEPPLTKLEERLHTDINRVESNLKLVASAQEERIENDIGQVKAEIDSVKKKTTGEMRMLEDRLSDNVTKLHQTISDKTNDVMTAAEAGIKGCVTESSKISEKLTKFKTELDEKVDSGLQALQKSVSQRTADISSRVEAGFKRSGDEFNALERRSKESTAAMEEKMNDKLSRLSTQVTMNKTTAEAHSQDIQKSLTESFENMKNQVAEQTEASEHRFVSRAAALEQLITKNYDEQNKAIEDRHRELTYHTERLEKTFQLELDDIRSGGETADRAHDAKLLEMSNSIAANHDHLKMELERIATRLESSTSALKEGLETEVLRLEGTLQPLEDRVETQHSHFTATFENSIKLVNIRVDHLSGAVTEWHEDSARQVEEVKQQMGEMAEKHDSDLDELHDYTIDNLKGLHKMFSDGCGQLLEKVKDNKEALRELSMATSTGLETTTLDLTARMDREIKKVDDKLHQYDQQKDVDAVRALCMSETQKIQKEVHATMQDKFEKMDKTQSSLESTLQKDMRELKEFTRENIKHARADSSAASAAVVSSKEALRSELLTKIDKVQDQVMSHKTDADDRQDAEMKRITTAVDKLTTELTNYKAVVTDQINIPIDRLEQKIADLNLYVDKKASSTDDKIKQLEEAGKSVTDAHDTLAKDLETQKKKNMEQLKKELETLKADLETQIESGDNSAAQEIARVHTALRDSEVETEKKIKACRDSNDARAIATDKAFADRLDREHTTLITRIGDTKDEIETKKNDLEVKFERKYEVFRQKTAQSIEDLTVRMDTNQTTMDGKHMDFEKDVKDRIAEETATRAQNIADIRRDVREYNNNHQDATRLEIDELARKFAEHKTDVEGHHKDIDLSIRNVKRDLLSTIKDTVDNEATERSLEIGDWATKINTELQSTGTELTLKIRKANNVITEFKQDQKLTIKTLEDTVNSVVKAKCDDVGDQIAEQKLVIMAELDTIKKTFHAVNDFIEETYDRLESIDALTTKAEEAGIIGMDAFLHDIVASATNSHQVSSASETALAATASAADRPDLFLGLN
eukprot:SAG31_NODE_782_length_12122_cov_122.151210_2_plen_1856_part_00